MSDFLFDQRLVYGIPDFSRFDPDLILPSAEEGLKRAEKRLAEIIDNPDLPTFKNTIDALNHHSRELDYVYKLYDLMKSIAQTPELTAAGEKLEKIVSDYSTDLLTSAPLFERIRFLHDNADKMDLNVQQKAILDKKFRTFSENGALLPDQEKEVLKDVNSRLALARTKYRNNLTAAQGNYFLAVSSEAELDGLPNDYKETTAAEAKKRGIDAPYALTIDHPTYTAVIENCKNRDIRRALYEGRDTISQTEPYDNHPVALEILNLRHQQAVLLGKNNHAEHKLQGRMFDTVEKVNSFIAKLVASADIAEKQELEELATFAREQDGLEQLEPWDVQYYIARKKMSDGLDPEEVRSYLPLDKVIETNRQHISKLFGLEFRAADHIPTYHPDVVAYELRSDPAQETPTAIILYDLYTRKGEKRSGAWANAIIDRMILEEGSLQIPIFSLNMNITKPEGGKPALLTTFNYTTVHHEMGHGLHAMLTEIDYEDIAGYNISYDAVELPSTVMEKYAAHPDMLRMTTRHHETGEPMPEDMIAKFSARGQDFPGIFMKRQGFFCALDMALHTTDPATIKSLPEFEENIRKSIGGTAYERSTSHRFQHIFAGGYSSGYYGYFSADIPACDAYKILTQNGLYDSKKAASFRAEILATGALDTPGIRYRAFAGRDPDMNEMFRALKLPVIEEDIAPAPAPVSPALSI